jgi:hypothetical protein
MLIARSQLGKIFALQPGYCTPTPNWADDNGEEERGDNIHIKRLVGSHPQSQVQRYVDNNPDEVTAAVAGPGTVVPLHPTSLAFGSAPPAPLHIQALGTLQQTYPQQQQQRFSTPFPAVPGLPASSPLPAVTELVGCLFNRTPLSPLSIFNNAQTADLAPLTESLRTTELRLQVEQLKQKNTELQLAAARKEAEYWKEQAQRKTN